MVLHCFVLPHMNQNVWILQIKVLILIMLIFYIGSIIISISIYLFAIIVVIIIILLSPPHPNSMFTNYYYYYLFIYYDRHLHFASLTPPKFHVYYYLFIYCDHHHHHFAFPTPPKFHVTSVACNFHDMWWKRSWCGLLWVLQFIYLSSSFSSFCFPPHTQISYNFWYL